MEARYAIGTGHYGSEVLDGRVKDWQIVIDAAVSDGEAFGPHLDIFNSVSMCAMTWVRSWNSRGTGSLIAYGIR